MKYDPAADPDLTAYALGELDEQLIPQVEARLLRDARSRQFVEQMRGTAELISSELRDTALPPMSQFQRRVIETELKRRPPESARASDRWSIAARRLIVSAAVAASIALLTCVVWVRLDNRQIAAPPTVAIGDAPPPPSASGTAPRVKRVRPKAPSTTIVVEDGTTRTAMAPVEVDLTGVAEVQEPQPPGPVVSRFGSVPVPPLPDILPPGVKGQPPADLPPPHIGRTPAGGPVQRVYLPLKPQTSSYSSGGEDDSDDDGGRSKGVRLSAAMSSSRDAYEQGIAGPQIVRPKIAHGTDSYGVAYNNPPPALPAALTVSGDSLIEVHMGSESEFPARRQRFGDEAEIRRRSSSHESYALIHDNEFKSVGDAPLSTFSLDVDTASYANIRRFINDGRMPPPDAVRIEEIVNYFRYADAAPPENGHPLAIHVEAAGCPWTPDHRLVRININAKQIHGGDRPAANVVFLIDVSGSMQPPNKLPLLKDAMKMLVRQLDERDRLAIVVYAGRSGVALPSTSGDQHELIIDAINTLHAGGSTNGGEGIQLAYRVAAENFIEGGVNRVILATDGDFNVGITDPGDLQRLIERQRDSRVFLSVLGFGEGNLKDATMQTLAQHGNGNHAYIDSLREARKVLIEQFESTMITVAKDVKLQVEFNPRRVESYRLIGYENRLLADADFNDDRKDAGDIGAGHTVTALYEIVPAGGGTIDGLKYQRVAAPPRELTEAAQSNELLTMKLRYKLPDGVTSRLMEEPLIDDGREFADASADFRFAAAAAAFGMVLRGSPYRGSADFDSISDIAVAAMGEDAETLRIEMLDLVRKARLLTMQSQ